MGNAIFTTGVNNLELDQAIIRLKELGRRVTVNDMITAMNIESMVEILQIIERIDALRSKGITVLIVEQNARLSLARSDRGYIFSNGKVVHTNSASHILKDPQINEYFLGTKKDE